MLIFISLNQSQRGNQEQKMPGKITGYPVIWSCILAWKSGFAPTKMIGRLKRKIKLTRFADV